VNLAQHLDRLLRLADSLGEPLVHCVIFSVRRAAETRAVDHLPDASGSESCLGHRGGP
jgi:hypothetical protein